MFEVFAPEQFLARDFHHRIPVDRRIVLRRRSVIRRRDGRDVHDLARRARDLCRIDQAIAARPHLIIGLRQIGHDEAPLIVGDHDFDKTHREIVRLRNHPHAGFGLPGRIAHDAAYIVIVDRDAFRSRRRAHL